MKIDIELKVISAITRSLPKIRGSGVLVNCLAMNVDKNKITNIALCQTGISDKEETLSLKLNTTGNRSGNSFAASGEGGISRRYSSRLQVSTCA